MGEDYLKARRLGQRQMQRDISAGRYPYPPALDDILRERGYLGETPVGTAEIPLSLVAGTRTRGRQDSFSSGFMPLLDQGSEFAAKWEALYDSQLKEGIREPVMVYEYLQRFYVQEGNKRVSVMRYLDAPSILARITRVVPMPSDDPAIESYQGFVRFYAVCPVYGIVVADRIAYEWLAALAGQTLDDPWPQETVRDLRASFSSFSAEFYARGGHDLSIEVGDAFVTYLSLYGFEAAAGMTPAEVSDAVGRIWGELVVLSSDDAIAYLEDPGDVSPKTIQDRARLYKDSLLATPFRVAFVHERNIYDSGWVALHERGRVELEDALGSRVRTHSYQDRAEDEAFDEAVGEALADGCDLVVTTTATQMDQTLRMATAHPEVTFVNCSVSLSHSAVRTFSARLYEVKFLMGALAASLATDHKVGYVSKAPLFGNVAEINAFAIGAQMVDAEAQVYLEWFSARDRSWRDALASEGVRVICAGDYPSPGKADEPWGLLVVGDDGEMERVANPIWRWGRAYELIVQSIWSNAWQREGEAFPDQALNYWWGISSGICDLRVSGKVPYGQRVLVDLLRQSLLSGRLTPFAGELRAQGGVLVQGEDAGRLSTDEIARMSWLTENVVGRLPEPGELKESALRQMEVSGVIPSDAGQPDCEGGERTAPEAGGQLEPGNGSADS